MNKLPDGWKLVKLKDVLIHRNEAPDVNDLLSGKIPVVSKIRFSDGKIELRENGDSKTGMIVAKRGDILISGINALKGAVVLLDEIEYKSVAATIHYSVYEPISSKVDPFYLLSLMRNDIFRVIVERYIPSGIKTELKSSRLLPIRVPLPPIEEQRAIVSTLRTIDETTDAVQLYVRSLLDSKTQIMGSILLEGFPDSTLRKIQLKASWREGKISSIVTEIPSHWKLVRLNDYATLESGHTPNRKHPEYWGGNIPWISLADTERLECLIIDETSEYIKESGIKNSSARILPPKTVVFSRTATVGLCALMGREMATSQDFANYVCGKELYPQYLVQVFRYMQREWRRLSAGSAHQTVYMPIFKKLKILLPPLNEQKRIAEIGESFDNRIAAERAYLAQLLETRKAIAQALLSGRVRVGDGVKAEKETGGRKDESDYF